MLQQAKRFLVIQTPRIGLPPSRSEDPLTQNPQASTLSRGKPTIQSMLHGSNNMSTKRAQRTSQEAHRASSLEVGGRRAPRLLVDIGLLSLDINVVHVNF